MSNSAGALADRWKRRMSLFRKTNNKEIGSQTEPAKIFTSEVKCEKCGFKGYYEFVRCPECGELRK